MTRHYTPSSWTLRCPWCDWRLIVNARGAHGQDPGSGVEAARSGERHAWEAHGRSWNEFLSLSESR